MDSESTKNQKLSEMTKEQKVDFLFQLIHRMWMDELDDSLLIATLGISPLVLRDVKALITEIKDILIDGVDLDNPRFKLVLELGELVRKIPKDSTNAT